MILFFFSWIFGVIGFAAGPQNPIDISKTTSPDVFRLHLVSEPSSLKPWEQKGSNGSYFLGQIFGSLLKLEDHKIKPSLAKKCEFKTPLLIRCELDPMASFSDGSTITAGDFERSFKEFLKPQNQAFRAELLFPVKNAESYFLGKSDASKLGIKARGKFTLEFQLESEDPEFIYNLTSYLLTPLKDLPFPKNDESEKLVTSGAYKILSWEPQKKMRLVHRQKPNILVEFLFISEDSVALSLYEKGELQFLRRLPTLFIPKFKERPDFHESDQTRFDYIGFGPELKEFPEVRRVLSESLDFTELNKTLFTKGSFGCPGFLPPNSPHELCVEYKAGSTLVLPKNLPKLKLSFSKLGGDDIKRTMEWVQAEWQKKLGLHVDLEQLDNKIFMDQLKTKPSTIFRKGFSLERPTCWAAMSLLEEGSSEDYLKIRTPEFLELLANLKKSISQANKYQEACNKTIKYLLAQHFLIPTGPIHFTLLAKPEWTGWTLNEMNQLDLSGLKKH